MWEIEVRLFLHCYALFLDITQFEDCAVEFEVVYYFSVVFLEVITIESFVVVKFDLYLLIHLPQLQLNHEFPLFCVNLQVIDLALCLLLTSE